jgi:Na+-translocating ferredoxin:NAD+ oxidoreductase RnfE subunit
MDKPMTDGSPAADIVAGRTAERRRRLPLFALLLAVSPAIAFSTRALYGLVLGGGIAAVLSLSTLAMALLGPLVSSRGRLLLHIAVGSVLTMVADLCLQAWAPAIRAELGAGFPLSAASAIIVGRVVLSGRPAPAGRSFGEATGLGLGIAVCLVCISCVREALGSGTLTLIAAGRFGGVLTLGALAAHPVGVMVQAAGALLAVGLLMGLARWVAERRRRP